MRADVQEALREVGQALSKAQRAVEVLKQVEALPKNLGAVVQWQGNGLHWERVGENAWQPRWDLETDPAPHRGNRTGDRTWPSMHVAANDDWRLVEKPSLLARPTPDHADD